MMMGRKPKETPFNWDKLPLDERVGFSKELNKRMIFVQKEFSEYKDISQKFDLINYFRGRLNDSIFEQPVDKIIDAYQNTASKYGLPSVAERYEVWSLDSQATYGLKQDKEAGK